MIQMIPQRISVESFFIFYGENTCKNEFQLGIEMKFLSECNKIYL